MYTANQRNTFMVFALFITVTTLKHPEAFDTAVYVFDEYSEF